MIRYEPDTIKSILLFYNHLRDLTPFCLFIIQLCDVRKRPSKKPDDADFPTVLQYSCFPGLADLL